MVVLGLGSNQGDRLGFLRKAIALLRARPDLIQIQMISPIYESNALLPENAPPSWDQNFLNLNLLLNTSLTPHELLAYIKNIEIKLGRQKRERWAPREIDLDILAIDSDVINTDLLKVPHPELPNRPFALLPFADLISNWRFPNSSLHSEQFIGKTIDEISFPWRRASLEQVPFRTNRTHFTITECVGILNITPDSFSDGGKFLAPEAALAQMQKLHQDGIQILDIGAESTRPGSTPISEEEEWKRLLPILELVPPQIKISLDTRHAQTAQRALEKGVCWINDVTGFEDFEMRRVVSQSNADVVMMHSLSVPPQKQNLLPTLEDPVSYLLQWGEKRILELEQSGIQRSRIIFDPGIGFGKTISQNWEIIQKAHRFHELGTRVLFGHSRKLFLTSITSLPAPERDIETLAISLSLAQSGVDYLRVHHSAFHSRALRAWSRSNGICP